MADAPNVLIEVASAARTFVHCEREIADGRGERGPTLEVIAARDAAYHDLLMALDEPCECEEGTCPG